MYNDPPSATFIIWQPRQIPRNGLPSDAAARHALAAHHALAGDYGTALAEWLELMRRDRAFGDDAGRRSLRQAFDVLGEQDPLVTHYRRRMASLLH